MNTDFTRMNQESRKAISEIKGKAARVAAKKRGQRLSFKPGNQESTLPELVNEIVVVLVRADPKPDDEITMLLCNSTIMITDSHGPDVCDKRLELH
jgi:hypothetical protein